ncbi:purine-uracil permease NCS1 [Olea europaea var. sylvestris]|uniref:purine-uracil permease NCS1 n=1 Tax=Olea europaea var. sylvestris TaxID=158386 RepID=UPI000C1CD6D8|nr:purine-uracil permease NCS1 [Olea europaea var. sylvestris]
MVSKCFSFHLHPHPHLALSSNGKINIPKTLIPKQISIQHQIYSNSNQKRCHFVTQMASSSQLQFDDLDSDPTLINDDLRPTNSNQRTFSGVEMASLWVGLVVGVPSYYLAGSLVDLGMSWWQGIATVVVANIILFVPLVLTGHPGTRYGISFPVLARSSFGIRGAHIPTLLRALVGCGWYGIETWIGGEAIFLLLPKAIKESSVSRPVSWLGTSPLEFACFIIFWLAQLGIVWKGIDGIRELEKYSAPILIILTSCLLIWSYVKAGGFSHMLSLSSRLSSSEFWSLFFPSLTANISFWATLALNIPDFTRYAKSQRDHMGDVKRFVVSYSGRFVNIDDGWKWLGNRTTSIVVRHDITYEELVHKLFEKLNVDRMKFRIQLKFTVPNMNIPPADVADDEDLQWFISVHTEAVLCVITDEYNAGEHELHVRVEPLSPIEDALCGRNEVDMCELQEPQTIDNMDESLG